MSDLILIYSHTEAKYAVVHMSQFPEFYANIAQNWSNNICVSYSGRHQVLVDNQLLGYIFVGLNGECLGTMQCDPTELRTGRYSDEILVQIAKHMKVDFNRCYAENNIYRRDMCLKMYRKM